MEKNDKGKELAEISRSLKCQTRLPSGVIDARILIGGTFDFVKGKVEYVGGELYLAVGLWVNELDVEKLRSEVRKGIELSYGRKKFDDFSIWYRMKGKNLTMGRMKVRSMEDVARILDTRDDNGMVTLYVLFEEPQPISPRRQFRCKNFQFPTAAQLDKFKAQTHQVAQPSNISQTGPNTTSHYQAQKRPQPQNTLQPQAVYEQLKVKLEKCSTGPFQEPVRSSPRLADDEVVLMGAGWVDLGQQQTDQSRPTQPTPLKPQIPFPISTAKAHNTKKQPDKAVTNKPPLPSKLHSSQPLPSKQPTTLPVSKASSSQSTPTAPLDTNPTSQQLPQPIQSTPPRRKHVARKERLKGKEKVLKGKEKEVRRSRKRAEVEQWSEDSEYSDVDVDFDPEEEDYLSDEEGERLLASEIQKQVNASVRLGRQREEEQIEGAEHREDLGDFGGIVEQEHDSDDLRSIQGSDEEVDPHPTFNASVDLKRPIDLKQGLKFVDVYVLRKALVAHAIENHYDFYCLHNSAEKFTAYCRNKCSCPWDSKHGRIRKCVCKELFKCPFKILARKMKNSSMLQIRTCKLRHNCGFQDVNSKVTSQYLAERYVEHFRADPGCSLKGFISLVKREVGVDIQYAKAWLARAKAKLMIYGDCSEQYAKVYDYGAAVLKFNPSSTVVITCEGVESGSPSFQRMYMCLAACKEGFRVGCRPLIGVDGCHLKGAYPGMILVAVGKDGNNNIFPIAWAVIEVENKDSWTWFFDLLIADVGFPLGEGLTVMSDRQKELLDAIETVVPKAEVRFCARHIWANFKLHFSGQAYKEHFWYAARTSSERTFREQLEAIKFMSEDAFNYLNDIPAMHWARHAFQTHSKSNMLLNNLCETFNSVLKEARDKPIITCMEWVRRYVMRRSFEKLTMGEGVDNRFMPYVEKVFGWVSKEALECTVIPASRELWEVSCKEDSLVVNLSEGSCTCKKWALTGIPCPHAYACIMKRRENPMNYVHAYYSKATYVQAYTPHVNPMPGMNHWEDTGNLKPLPPPFRKMPGRPSEKKRRKEAGEDLDDRFLKRLKRQNTCSNCGGLGHNKVKCKNPPKEKGDKKGGRPASTDMWPVSQRNKKKKKNEAVQAALGSQVASSSNLHTDAPIPSQSTQQSQNKSKKSTTATKATTPSTGVRAKMPVKPKKKTMLPDLNET